MRAKLFFLSVACFIATIGFSQPLLTEANPATAGLSADRLNRIDALFQEYIQKKFIGGGTAILVKDGKIVYHKAFGYNEDATKTALKRDAIFRIASQTKAITSVAIMMLYEEGKLMLDDAVAKYIPEFKQTEVLDKYNAADTTYTTVKAKRLITIRDLLTHTSGIGYAQIGSAEAVAIYAKAGIVGGIGVGQLLLGDKMKKLAALPLFHQPGEKWTYGLNTDLLGYLVEVVSGKDLATFFKQKIFDPLGMKDTYFFLPKEKHNRLATLYTQDSLGLVTKMPASIEITEKFIRDYPNTDGTYYSGGGGLSSTALDYAVFMQMLLNNGKYNGKRILSPMSVRMMTSDQYEKLGWPGKQMGLGFGIYTEKSEATSPLSAGSYEWGGMFSSTYWIDPKEKIVAQLFLNQYPNTHGDIHDKFKVLVYAAIDK